MRNMMTEKAEREMERIFDMNRRVWQLMDIICAEFESDPTSVQCFDACIVREACELVKERARCGDMCNPFRQ